LFFVSEAFAYSVKVYDEYGNRVGTYRKEGGKFQLYDFHDNKVENEEAIIEDAPDSKTLTEYSQTFYDENMMPIGTWHSGFYGNDGRYYPRRGVFYPSNFHGPRTPYIVRPHAHTNHGIYQYSTFVDTRYPRFHRFNPY
jgi:hypothetical protein